MEKQGQWEDTVEILEEEYREAQIQEQHERLLHEVASKGIRSDMDPQEMEQGGEECLPDGPVETEQMEQQDEEEGDDEGHNPILENKYIIPNFTPSPGSRPSTPIYQPPTQMLDPERSPPASPPSSLYTIQPIGQGIEHSLTIQKLEALKRLRIHLDLDEEQGYPVELMIPPEHQFQFIRMAEYTPQTNNNDNPVYKHILNEDLYTVSVQLPDEWCRQHTTTPPMWLQIVHITHEDHSSAMATDDLLRAVYDKWFYPPRHNSLVVTLGPLTPKQSQFLFEQTVFFANHYEWASGPVDMRYLRPYMTNSIKPQKSVDPLMRRHLTQIQDNKPSQVLSHEAMQDHLQFSIL